MKNPLKFFGKLFSWLKVILSDQVLDRVKVASSVVLPIAAIAAKFTPLPFDDALVALCGEVGVPMLDWYRAVPEADRPRTVIRDIVRRALKEKLKNKMPDLSGKEINLAIEAAVLLIEEQKKKKQLP